MSLPVSVITLTHNKLEYTRRCVGSLLASDASPWELVVVDNGSTDGTRKWLRDLAPQAEAAGVSLTVQLNDGNIGCSTARNQGAALATGDKLVFIDNDVALCSAGWIRDLLACLDSEPTLGMVGPKLVYPFEPHAIQCAGVAVSATGRVQFLGRGDARDTPRYNEAREVQALISACIMMPRPVFDACGGFDEAFNPVEYEDIDLCYKVRQAGYTLRVVPSVEMYHFENVTTSGTSSLPNTYLIIKNGLLFKTRWKHMFENESGPADHETRWRELPSRPLAEIGDLPVEGQVKP